jgi:hypothetical protein
MVEAIGIVVVVGLSWLLASGMATESDAEKRRLARMAKSSAGSETGGKRAA